jgi:predicted nucleotidyltransferase component of viral defense system
MISKEEIDLKAAEFDIHVANVQRDYVFGWLLKAISENSYLGTLLILKGGNCFRKAYFPDTRFSEDLDFSTESELDPEKFKFELNQCCREIQSVTQVQFDIERSTFNEGRSIGLGSEKRQTIYKARVYFDDFYGEKASIVIAVRLDISEFDKIYLPPKTVQLIHPYSDSSVCAANIRCLALEEMVASKMKCLLQRRHSHDLFDMAYIYLWRNEFNLNRSDVLSVFLRKTIFRPSPFSAKSILLGLPFEFFKSVWERYIVCPTQSRFSFDDAATHFRGFIEELFEGHTERRDGSLAYFPAQMRNPIMDAARERKLLKVTYDGVPRLVEPYALTYKRRQDNVAQEYFYCWDTTGGSKSGPGVKTFLNPKITAIEKTDTSFEPRYEIELSKAGEQPKQGHFAGAPRSRSLSGLGRFNRVSTRSAFGHSYVVQCPYCQKRFKRKTSSLTLKAHKSADGYSCSGRRGYLV